MKVVIKADHREAEAYENLAIAAACATGDGTSVIAEINEAKKNPGVVDHINDGFADIKVTMDERGGIGVQVDYDSETVTRIINIATEHHHVILNAVKWIAAGLELFDGFNNMLGKMSREIQAKKEAYVQTERTGTDG